MSNVATPIAEQLREIREYSRILKSELAQLIGTSLVAVEQWERSSASPSPKQQVKINDLFKKVRSGEKLRKNQIVLQNGTFAYKGATRQALKSKQADLFAADDEVVEVLDCPTASILSLIKYGRFLSNSQQILQLILEARHEPAMTPAEVQRIEMSAGKIPTHTMSIHTTRKFHLKESSNL